MRIALVGGGFMGESFVAGVLSAEVVTAADVCVAEIQAHRREHLARTYNVAVMDSAAAAVASADVVLFAVKPQEFEPAVSDVIHALDDQIVISCMAGVTMATLASHLKVPKIVRVMPNTPASVREAVSVWTCTEALGPADLKTTATLLEALGQQIFVEDEKYLDMATALSASGPGFIFLLIEAFIDAGVHIGFRREVAEKLAYQTFLGSVKYAQATGLHPAVLRNQVTSPGGTTAEGLLIMERMGVRAAIVEAVEAAWRKSIELGSGGSRSSS
ncbi:MAG: pyrroline-5-carboxylate reductase [Dehalococcoidia bacterium]|nr:pyrroline-5-carboxylate reductase [Dehalococcoidia bacterium]